MGVQVPPFALSNSLPFYDLFLYTVLNMDLIGFCTADSYQTKPLLEHLKKRYNTTQIRDVIHFEWKEGVDVFVFAYGLIVTWGIPRTEGLELIKELKPFEEKPEEVIEWDEFTYVQGDSPHIYDDEIVLPDFDLLTKLAISHGIAQSVELANFEVAIQNLFNNTRKIPEDLAKKGKISFSRREIRRKMGELFLERSTINLHLDVLDLPEFFWDYPELEPLYQMIANYLDIRSRVEVLNHRLDIIHELYEVLANELNHQHSSRLEWTIILLIIIEVALTLLRDVFGIL